MDDIIGTHRCLKRLELLLLRRLVRLYLLRSLRARILQSLYAIYNTNTGVSDSNNNVVPARSHRKVRNTDTDTGGPAARPLQPPSRLREVLGYSVPVVRPFVRASSVVSAGESSAERAMGTDHGARVQGRIQTPLPLTRWMEAKGAFGSG